MSQAVTADRPAVTADRREGVLDRISDFLISHPKLLTLLLLLPPLLWIGVVYVGSLFALLLQSFYSLDDYSGLIIHEFTLSTYTQLLETANLQIILRTVMMAALVTVACAVIAFPIAYYAARYARGLAGLPLADRGTPDLVLALALVHHLIISRTIPQQDVVDWFADLGGDLVVEFPHRDDVMVARLLARKREGSHPDYTRERFEEALRSRFDVLGSVELPSGTRTLYHAAPR